MAQTGLSWQSKLVMLLVVPLTATDVTLKTAMWTRDQPTVAIWTLGLSMILGLVTWKLRAATPAAAATGTIVTASLMYSTLGFPYQPWHTAIMPVLAVSLLAFASTRAGRAKKERLGTAERHEGRSASQVAANLGVAALVSSQLFYFWMDDAQLLSHIHMEMAPFYIAALAALAEAAADTVSSELGQIIRGRPRMLTTLRFADPGTNGAVSVAGSLAGIVAAAIVALAGTWALRGTTQMLAISAAGGVFGLFFDSLLGATFENGALLNNDAVNFLSTASAAGFALVILAFVR